MAGNTPRNPTRRPTAPSGGVPPAKGPSKPMSPMPPARPSRMGNAAPAGSSGVNPKGQSQTVEGSPKR